ncbi:hypothetical protein ACH5RR_033706 [Cinchona calisaya]|uniref:DUF4216 domain-containing protein n=1 Tax=Cinchona calisaya TaxID=153742 RepID=A0ABD2YCC0_9GENT
MEEVTTFASYYFEPHVQSKRQRASRNDEGPVDPNVHSFSIFNYLEVEYPGPAMCVVLFKCLWYDPVKGMNVHSKYNLVDINHKKRYKSYEPFILAQQAVQVYYAQYPSLKQDRADWLAVCKTRARSKVEEH